MGVWVCVSRVLMLRVLAPGPPEWLLFHVTGCGLLPNLWTPGLGQVCARPRVHAASTLGFCSGP